MHEDFVKLDTLCFIIRFCVTMMHDNRKKRVFDNTRIETD